MFILELLLGLKSKQVDVTATFIHADIPEIEEVYVKTLRGFNSSSRMDVRNV